MHGSGEWGARRAGGKRRHNGIDYAVAKYSIVLSGVSGTVTKIGYPYNPSNPKKGEMRYIEITTDDNIAVRYFYVQPNMSVEKGKNICSGDKIGISQNIESIYPGMTNHIHLELKINGKHVNPMDYKHIFS